MWSHLNLTALYLTEKHHLLSVEKGKVNLSFFLSLGSPQGLHLHAEESLWGILIPSPSWSSVSLCIFLDKTVALKSLQRSLMGVHLIHNLLFLCPALRILGALTKQCAKRESYLRHVCPLFDLSACAKGITWLSQSKFCEILYWAIWLKFIDALHFCFKLDENNCHNKWRAT